MLADLIECFRVERRGLVHGSSKDGFDLRTVVDPYAAVGLGLASGSAVTQQWSLPEFGWSPWRRVLVPFQGGILRVHIMVLALPIRSMIAWALFREAYQSITIVLLMGLFYLLSQKRSTERVRSNEAAQSVDWREPPIR